MTFAPAQMLKQFPSARRMVKKFPKGCRVRVDVSRWEGTVVGHVLGTNAQGGMLKVQWDRDGRTSRCTPINFTRIADLNDNRKVQR
jgi:hypothetical protein